jgi:hypothetical protein
MIEILPPLGKYKYDTWRIFLVKCCIDNSVHFQSCIRNVNRVHWLYVCRDSKLIINQVMGESNYHDSHMAAYRHEVRKLEEKFDGFELHHIPR